MTETVMERELRITSTALAGGRLTVDEASDLAKLYQLNKASRRLLAGYFQQLQDWGARLEVDADSNLTLCVSLPIKAPSRILDAPPTDLVELVELVQDEARRLAKNEPVA